MERWHENESLTRVGAIQKASPKTEQSRHWQRSVQPACEMVNGFFIHRSNPEMPGGPPPSRQEQARD